jgi:hypothetical protein
MTEIDKRHILNEAVFSYFQSKDGKIFISWHGQQVKILKGSAAQRFAERISRIDPYAAQLLMARVTGNFKRGNEKRADST